MHYLPFLPPCPTVLPISNASAPSPHLNLAILYDLYLGDVAKAQALYQRCVELSPGDASQLNRWLAELKGRKPVPNTPQDPATAAPAAAPSAAPAAQAGPSVNASSSASDATAVARRKDTP